MFKGVFNPGESDIFPGFQLNGIQTNAKHLEFEFYANLHPGKYYLSTCTWTGPRWSKHVKRLQ